ncbi:MAG: hypothetical protein E6R03_09550 [Hyphomicrobiaceae bacterium]|nr:MAG: hypothetical protein E6R03_09550 [Hyphomicrobiaceae bacterium]
MASYPYNYSPQTPFTDTALKIEQGWALDVTKNESTLFRLLERGMNAGTLQEYPSGGSQFIFELVNGYSASGGLPDSNNSIAGIGRYNETNSKVGITPFFDYGRTTITQQEMESILGNDRAYYDRKQLKLKNIYGVMAHRYSSIMYGTGQYGIMGQVTSTGGGVTVNSASATFSLTVKQVERLPKNQDVFFLTSAGADISNCLPGIVVDYSSVQSGEGAVTFVFPTYVSTSFTIPNDALICVVNSRVAGSPGSNLFYANGLDEMIGTATHPRAEGNNTTNNSAQYKSQVIALSSGSVDIWKLRWLLQLVKKNCATRRLETDGAEIRGEKFDEGGYVRQNMFVLLMHPDTKLKLEKAFYDGKLDIRTDPGWKMGQTVDEGIRYDTFQGVPLIEDLLCGQDRIFLVHLGAIGKATLVPFGPPPFTTTEFIRVPETLNYELVRRWAGNYVPLYRDCLGKISVSSGVLGVTASEMTGA